MDVGDFQQLSVDIESLLINSRSDLIPVAYNSSFNMKEKFVDAISHRRVSARWISFLC